MGQPHLNSEDVGRAPLLIFFRMAAGGRRPVPGPGAAKTEPSRVQSDFDLSQCRRPNSSRVRLSGGRTEIGRPSYRLRQACPSSGRSNLPS